MKRKQRTKICVHCDEKLLHKWAQLCEEQAEFNTIEEPSNALTMIKMRESAQNTLFYLGELLVSETRVECNTHIGIGLVQGDNFMKSYDMAVIDAAFNANIHGIDKIEKELLVEEKRQQKEIQKEIQKILKTRVKFETMDVKGEQL